MNTAVSRYRRVQFLKSSHALSDLPPDQGAEVAFAGRSNAGKSSAINAITGVKGLARTSKTPGRTQLINFFTLDEDRRLVDLPGYGYAKVPVEVKRHWERTLALYLESRQSLRGLILLMDVRHPLTDYDNHMLAWSQAAGLPVHVLLTKADKLNRGPALNTLHKVRGELSRHHQGASVQLFSALKHTGIGEAHAMLDHWLNWGTATDHCQEE